MKVTKFIGLSFKKHVKVKIDKEVCDTIINKNKYLSKKDIGSFISELIRQQKNIDEMMHNYLLKKYALDRIIDTLKNSEKNAIPFREIRRKFDISKRKFYPRLRIIKRYFLNRPGFNWTIKRGKFVRVE